MGHYTLIRTTLKTRKRVIDFDDFDNVRNSGYYDEELRFSETRKKIATNENAKDEAFKISADDDIVTIESAEGCIVTQSDLRDANVDCCTIPEFEPSEHSNIIEGCLKSNQRHYIEGYGSCVLGVNPHKEIEL